MTPRKARQAAASSSRRLAQPSGVAIGRCCASINIGAGRVARAGMTAGARWTSASHDGLEGAVIGTTSTSGA